MKSAWARRRLGSGSAAFENEPAGAAPPPKVRAATSVDRSNIIAATTVDVDVPVAAIETAATTCHCPSARGALSFTCPSFPTSPTSTRVPEGSSWTSCRVCERLHGHPEESEDEVDLRSARRARHASEDLAGMPSARTFDREKRIRHGPSSRCVSSVVRWSHRQPSWKHLSFEDGPDERAVGGAHGCTGFTGSTPRRQTSFVWTILFLLVLAVPTLADVQQGAQHKSSRKDGVCQSIDIRNSVRSFSKLNGCRVVEGFVQILLINNAEPHEYANISFPELREITGYLLLHRVMGLRSVGHLFPNLQVIRGSSLLLNYALMAYEVMNLKEIGLHSLTTIVRGSVRIVENPSLCYVDTIDWDLIGKAGKGEHVVSGNNPRNGCPVCEKHCPVGSKGSPLCWNQQHCQRICDQKCENNACDENGNCCHPTCLGTCTGPTNRDCSVCKDVLTLEGDCQARCPNGTFEFMDHRCVEEEMCHQMRKPLEAYKVKDYPYKPFNGSCVIECPAGFMDKEINGKAYCKKCKGPCQKECPGDSVESIASAQNLRGCTRITGNLVIQIRGGKNIVKELEDSLSRIEEIDGYLKVVRSFPLISLNFLKNLRVIRGRSLDNNKYTFVVFENQNLQELWDWSWHPTVQILSPNGPGKVFFHFNPKLCLYKIDALREKAGLGEFTDLEVASSSNGDKVACNVTELKTRAASKSPWGVVIEWEPFTHHDMRSLLGYVVYFIEAPFKNVTMYDGRDACGGDGWRVDDVPASRSANRSSKVNQTLRIQEEYIQTHYLTQLKPYTQYAYYVKTSTIATERSGGQSNITYFRTLPEAPTPPRFLTFACNSSSELIMSWLPPLQNNGNLTHYRITARLERDDPNFIDQRNYCDEPMSLPTKEEELATAEQEKKTIEEEKKRFEEERKQSALDSTGTCKCPDRETDQSLREKEVTSSMLFEDAVQNKVYVKRPSIKMKRDTFEKSIVATRSLRMSDQPIVNKLEHGSYVTFDIEVPSTNLTYVMKQLRHFALYNIEMRACRAQEVDDLYKRCSTKRMGTYRTLPLEGADNIPPNTFKLSTYGENNSLTTVTLQWEEPPQPNGLIITYHIEYNRVEAQNVTPTEVCVTRRNFVNAGKSYTLSKDLQAGNYSVRVRAMSLAGYGAHTETKYFYIKKHTVLGTFWVVFWSLLLFVALAIGVVALCVCKQKLVRNVRNMTLIATVNPEYVSTPYVIDEWEVPREKIEVLRPLGNGSFGMVYEGLAKDIIKDKPEVRCAVKTVNKDATERERNEFLNEASVMKGFDAHHVVKLLGVVTRGQPTLVIMELMVNGDLKSYLRSHRPGTCENYTDTPPKLDRILRMAIEIADGMAYLATKKFVHRDLAARNCMVAEDLTVKVGDFGMTRDVYERDYYRKGTKGLLPVRWMAPESLKDGVFSSYSDVWSYGVVLWEMATFASQPYQGLSNDQVLRYVIEGGVMERPENCPELLYEMMKRTWIHKANRRPTFMDIAANLLEHVDLENFKRISFYHSPEGIEARNQNRSNSPPIEQHPELAVLQDLREEEPEGEESSPLRQDFGDFASFEPRSVKNSLSPCHGLESYGENSKTTANCHDANSFNVPLKAGFDDFDGISGDSLTSAKDIFNPPLVEESLKSAKSSSFVNAKSPSRGNLRQLSMAKSGSPRNSGKRSYLSSPNPPKRPSPDYENGSPEILSSIEKREEVPLRVDFPLIDTDNGIEKKETMSTVEYVNKPESLNNGYIGGTTT